VGENSFDHVPAAVIGASSGPIGTALGQQSLRDVLSFCNARQMTSPEAYIQYSPEVFRDDGEVTNDATRQFLSTFASPGSPTHSTADDSDAGALTNAEHARGLRSPNRGSRHMVLLGLLSS
jgi:NAD(P)H-dependent FMN reductase